MNKAMIKHRPLSEDAHAINAHDIVIRLQTAKDDMKDVILMYGDTAYQGNPVVFSEAKMEKVATDMYRDYYEVTIRDSYERMVYYFDLYSLDSEHVYFYADILTDQLTVERNDLFKFPFNRQEDIIDVPKWFKKAIIYNVFLDSYTTKEVSEPQVIYDNHVMIKNKNGGTINDLMNQLDHIQSLGFNTIYLNPIFCAGEYHKYDTIDYMKIDPLFGTNEAFKTLVDEIHNRHMYIIIDGVFNHSGWYFMPFDDVIKNQEQSRYKDWFYHLDFPVYRPEIGQKPPYHTFGYERLMPKLNTSNPEVINYFLDVCRLWTKTYQIDGWRLDVADEVNTEFWRLFRKEAKSINPEVVLIGEVWQSAQYFLDGSMFDSVMNYDFIKHLKAFFAHKTIDSEMFNARISNMLMRYRTHTTYGQMNLLDSHDVPRFLSLVNENINIYQLAVIFLMTFIGVPSVFYGDEEGLVGITEDEYRRKPLSSHPELRAFYQDLIKLRSSYHALTLGKYKAIQYDKDSYLYHYIRYTDDMEIGIILNNSSESCDIIDVGKYDILMSYHHREDYLDAYGYVIYKK